jgi:hypothetical protein
MIEPHRDDRAQVRAGRDRHITGGELAPRASPPEGPTHIATGTGEPTICCTSEFTFTSTDPEASIWNTSSEMCDPAASRRDFVIKAAFEGSSRPFTCTITIPFRPELGGAASRPAASGRGAPDRGAVRGADPATPAHERSAASTRAAVARPRSRTWGDRIGLS